MFNSGLCYAEMKDLENAKKAFNNVIAIDPDYAYAYYAIAMAYEAEENYAAAIENFEKFVTLSTEVELKNQVKAQIEYLKTKVNE